MGGTFGEHPLTKSIIYMGRQADNDIVLHYSAIADRHLQLEVTTSGVRVINLRRAGGVLLNKQRIPLHTRHPFLPGDVLRIGRCYLLSLTLKQANLDFVF